MRGEGGRPPSPHFPYQLKGEQAMMTEREAWLEIAGWWENEPKLHSIYGMVELKCSGTFDCLWWVKVSIGDETYKIMRSRLDKELNARCDRGEDFLFLHTKEGAQQEAALCRQLADECVVPTTKENKP
jgi:hypothetical protein